MINSFFCYLNNGIAILYDSLKLPLTFYSYLILLNMFLFQLFHKNKRHQMCCSSPVLKTIMIQKSTQIT